MDNCLVIIHSNLLPVFPLSAGEFLFPSQGGQHSSPDPLCLPTLRWGEKLGWCVCSVHLICTEGRVCRSPFTKTQKGKERPSPLQGEYNEAGGRKGERQVTKKVLFQCRVSPTWGCLYLLAVQETNSLTQAGT